ncbi:MAG: nitrogen fixation protein NifH [Anaerolineales bacterium]|nr:nitrogen fixation protein NifH [Anaerolineales bacterium]
MQDQDVLDWLLERDEDNPSVRYFTLTDLLDKPADDPQVVDAREKVMVSGPVPSILDAQSPEGYWAKPGSGYSPKYRATSWQILFLAELGADPTDERVRRGCEYLLSHSITSDGAFGVYRDLSPRGALHCLNGNLLYALGRLGWSDDPRLHKALVWQAGAVLGEGHIQYYQSGTSGPAFACGVNLGQPCAWCANKALRAMLGMPASLRTPEVERAIQVGVDFLFSRDPAVADYPYSGKVSPAWFKFGFPLSYWSDVLETVDLLVKAGYGDDPRLGNALDFILSKQDKQGRWYMRNSLNGKMWADIERRGKPSKWVTLRALRVLKEISTLPGVR